MDSNNTSLEVLLHLPKHEFLHDQSNVITMNFNLISSQRAQKKNSTIRNHVTAKFPCYPRSHQLSHHQSRKINLTRGSFVLREYI